MKGALTIMENLDFSAILAKIDVEAITAFIKGLLDVVVAYVKGYFAK